MVAPDKVRADLTALVAHAIARAIVCAEYDAGFEDDPAIKSDFHRLIHEARDLSVEAEAMMHAEATRRFHRPWRAEQACVVLALALQKAHDAQRLVDTDLVDRVTIPMVEDDAESTSEPGADADAAAPHTEDAPAQQIGEC